MGDVNTLLSLRSVELSKAVCLRKQCYSKISLVMLLGYRIAENLAKTRVRTNRNMPCAQMMHI